MRSINNSSRSSSLSLKPQKHHPKKKTSSKFQRCLNLSNVFLLLMSTVLIFSSLILMKYYHIDKLDFWSPYFRIAPVLMLSLGVYTSLVCVFGFFVAACDKRSLITAYCFLLIIAFCAQMFSIFAALKLRTIVSSEAEPTILQRNLNRYGWDNEVTQRWDDIQTDLRCCGGYTGYMDYQRTAIGVNNQSVPDTCCHEQSKDCGRHVLRMDPIEIRGVIYTDGCLSLLKAKLVNDVIPMMIVYACVGVILAMIEIVSVTDTYPYVNELSLKMHKLQMMEKQQRWKPVASFDNLNNHKDDSLSINQETV